MADTPIQDYSTSQEADVKCHWCNAKVRVRGYCSYRCREKSNASSRSYASANRRRKSEIDVKYKRERLKVDPAFKLLYAIRKRVNRVLAAQGKPKTWSVSRDLDLDLASIVKALGPRPGPDYHLGHRVPCSLFDHVKPDHVKACWSPANLFWQRANENMRHGNRASAQIAQAYFQYKGLDWEDRVLDPREPEMFSSYDDYINDLEEPSSWQD